MCPVCVPAPPGVFLPVIGAHVPVLCALRAMRVGLVLLSPILLGAESSGRADSFKSRGYCSLADLSASNGTWVPTEQPARYRLYRDLQRNPLVKGWAFGMRRFWGMCDEGLPDNVSREEATSRWEPSDCKLFRFDPAKLCDHLVPQRIHDNPEILFIGDSYTGELFISFVSLMKGSIWRNEGDAPRTLPTGAWVKVGEPTPGRVRPGSDTSFIPISELRADAIACVDETTRGKLQRPPLRISFRRNEFILPENKSSTSGYRHGYAWLPHVKRNTILVAQVTAWLGHDVRALNERIRVIAKEVQRQMRNPRQQVYFVSPSRGHHNCRSTTGYGVVIPPLGPNDTQIHVSQLMHAAGKVAVEENGFTYIDMTTPLHDRSDGHMPSDCGHWCLPGPYDVGADLLFHALLTRKKVGRLYGSQPGSRRVRTPIEDLRNSEGRGITVDGKFTIKPLAEHIAKKIEG